MEKEILLKNHKSYRHVVAICDKELHGKKLSEGKRSLDLSGQFFKGEELSINEAEAEIVRLVKEDATFNVVGEKSVKMVKDLGLVSDDGIMTIEDIPFTLILV